MSNIIKSIRTRKLDGTYSELSPIGVDIENVFLPEGTSLNGILTVETDDDSKVLLGNEEFATLIVYGGLIVMGLDGVHRQIVFNADGTCGWTAVE